MIEVPTLNFRVVRTAIKNGCEPQYSKFYGTFVCGCSDLRHACDSQCSAISAESSKRTEAPRSAMKLEAMLCAGDSVNHCGRTVFTNAAIAWCPDCWADYCEDRDAYK